ncbi:MAG: dihydropteroate synthase [Bacteroidetes bacterium]|nr:dihydropteroate synthase [Bacteroidota bacterium]
MHQTADISSFPLRGNTLDLASRCRVMGILNVTPDSFSDGGRYADPATAIAHAMRMEAEGADIIDIGGESTRPGARSISAAEEIARVLPVITGIRSRSEIPISIDTQKAEVAEASLNAGADMLNDISALRHDSGMLDCAVRHAVPVVLMHMQGSPENMQEAPHYTDVVEEVLTFFRERVAFCRTKGVAHVIVDPGIGFGKTVEHNLALLRALPRFTALGVPLLVGTSRKSFLGAITGLPAEQRLGASIAAQVYACRQGAHLLRVHDVRETRAALDLLYALEGGEVTNHAF